MSKQIVYAYVIPADSLVDEASLIQSVNAFISGRQWLCPDVWAVNQKHEPGERELGINIALPRPQHEPRGWFSDIEAIVALCVQLRHEFECDFVLGIAQGGNHAEDIIEIENDQPNIHYLKKFIGAEPPTTAVQP